MIDSLYRPMGAGRRCRHSMSRDADTQSGSTPNPTLTLTQIWLLLVSKKQDGAGQKAKSRLQLTVAHKPMAGVTHTAPEKHHNV